MAKPPIREVSSPSSPKRGLPKQLKRALVVGGVLCSLMLPMGGYLAPRYYAPRIPVQWRQSIRDQAKWVHELWLQSRVSRPDLEKKVEQASRRVRLFPPTYFEERQRQVHQMLNKPGSPQGSLEGEDLPSADSNWPPALRPGAIMIRTPDVAAHEFVHYVGQSHPGLMRSHPQSAAATSRYLDPQSMVHGQTDIPVRLDLSDSKATMHCTGNQAKITYGFDLRSIESGFHQPTMDSENRHNDHSSAGSELGHLARLEEERIRKPGYGLLVIRLVAQGSKVADALKRAKEPDLEKERQELIRNNPVLDWSKSP